jgi:raffinose/stachyose/melibiose transport system substrate-binding protein
MRISPFKVLLATSACLVATACTGGAPGGSSDSDSHSKVLKYLIEEPEDATALKELKAHIRDFETSSGIKVQVTTLPFDTMRTVLQTQLRSGDGPDVFSWGSGPSFGGALAKAGLLYDLSDAYAKYHWKVFDFAKQRVTYGGKVYGVPGELETVGVFYNKRIFKSLGIAQPKSVEDLIAASQKIKAAGKVPMAVGDKEGWEGGHYLSMALSSSLGSDGMQSLFDGARSWDSPQVVSALKLWQDFDKDGFMPKSPTSVDYDSATSLFYSGDAAMIPTGTWLVGEIDDNAKFPVGYVPFPAPDGSGIFAGGLGSGPYISSSAPNKDAAVQFVNFLASPANGRWTVETLHTIPPMPLKTDDLDVSPLFRQVLDDTAKVSTGGEGDFGYNIDVLTSDAFNEAMYDGFQGVLTGQKSPEEVAASLQAASKQ